MVANTNRIQAIADTAVITANASTGMRSNPAEMYAGNLVPGRNRLNARVRWPLFPLGFPLRVFSFLNHPANNRYNPRGNSPRHRVNHQITCPEARECAKKGQSQIENAGGS